MILSHKEICELTNKRRFKAQARELVALGIPHKLRTDGSIVVYSSDVRMEAKAISSWEPDFSVLSKR